MDFYLEAIMMKKVMLIITLITVAVLILAMNIQPVFATFPTIQLTKTAVSIEPNGSNYDITYQFTAKNTGIPTSTSLTNIIVVDDTIHGSVVGLNVVNWGSTILAIGDTTTPLTWKYTTKPSDIDTDSTGKKTVTNIATVHSNPYNSFNGKTDTATVVADNDTYTVDIPGPISTLPEMPAGILFGVGLAGIGGFILIKRRSKVSSAK
jgi:hypothetical protein